MKLGQMEQEIVSQLIGEAQDYPLLDRLAVRLYRGGVRWTDMIEYGKATNSGMNPWTVNLTGKLRDIEFGFLKIDETLERLARDL